jgi:hypothetical protein
MDLTKLSKTELLEKCEEVGIKKYKSKNKSELIYLINNKTQNKLIEHDEENKTDIIITSNTQNYNLLDILNGLFTKYSNEPAKELNVATGTITRWIELNDIPKFVLMNVKK